TSPALLLHVDGVSEASARDFGPRFIEAIERFCKTAGLKPNNLDVLPLDAAVAPLRSSSLPSQSSPRPGSSSPALAAPASSDHRAPSALLAMTARKYAYNNPKPSTVTKAKLSLLQLLEVRACVQASTQRCPLSGRREHCVNQRAADRSPRHRGRAPG